MTFNIFDTEGNTILDLFKISLPVICVLLGALIGFGFQKFNEHLQFKKIRKYFFFSLYHLYMVIIAQIDQIAKIIETLDSKSNDKPVFLLVTGFSLNNIKVVSNETIYRIITNTKPLSDNKCKEEIESQAFKDNSNLIFGFEFIERLIPEFTNDGLFIYNSINDKLEEFKKITISIRDEIFKIKFDFNVNGKSSLMDLVKELDESDKNNILEFKEKNLDINNYYGYYNITIRRLKDISGKYDQIKLLSLCMDAEICYIELNGSKANFSKKYNTYKEYLEDIKNQFFSILFRHRKYLNLHLQQYIEENSDTNEFNK